VRAWGMEHGDTVTAFNAEEVIALVHAERGEPTPSLDHWYEQMTTGNPATTIAVVVAETALAANRSTEARRVLELALERTPVGELDLPARLVRACLRLGALDLARRALVVGAFGDPVAAAGTVAARAMVAEAEGDAEAARIGFGNAAERFGRLGIITERAYALVGLGRCLVTLKKTDEGAARLREARAIWERLRATPRIAEIDAVLEAQASSPTGTSRCCAGEPTDRLKQRFDDNPRRPLSTNGTASPFSRSRRGQPS
jgi:hypothetical protein